MKKNHILWIALALLWIFFFLSFASFSAKAAGNPQQPTIVMPTVTGTPIGAFVVVKMDQPQINVRSGPGVLYPKIGVLLSSQEVPAKGRSVGGDWILVDYAGVEGGLAWVYAPLVDVSFSSTLPIVEPPPTPTPLYTTTIDPTLAAQFVITQAPSRLPTFTYPAPLAIATFPPNQAPQSSGILPMGLVIVIVASLGIILGAFSLIRGK